MSDQKKVNPFAPLPKHQMNPNLKQWLIQTEGIGTEFLDNEKVIERLSDFTGSLSLNATKIEVTPGMDLNLSQGVSKLTESTIKVTEEAVKAVGVGAVETFNAGSDLINLIIKGPTTPKKSSPKEQKQTVETQIYLENRSVIAQALSEYKTAVDVAIGKEQTRLLEDVGGAGMNILQLNEVQGKNKNYLHKLSVYEIGEVRRALIERKQATQQQKTAQSITSASVNKGPGRLDKIQEGGSVMSVTGGNVG